MYGRSVYQLRTDLDETTPREKSPEPPVPQPRTTVSRPVTLATLREAKAAAAHRLPITERTKEVAASVVPAREKLKRKTIAFGATVNVSQTVEREKDHPRSEPRPSTVPRAPAAAKYRTPPTVPPVMASNLARTGVGAATVRPTRNSPLLMGGAATAAAASTPLAGDENRDPAAEGGGDEKEQLRAALHKESTRVARLESRVVDLERRERETRTTVQEFQTQITNLVEVVSKLTRRVHELKESVHGKEKGRGGEGRRERSSEDEEDVRRPFRRLHLPDMDQREERRGGTGGGRHTITPRRLLSDEETRRALERQVQSNPVLLRQLQDAVAEDAYERDYGAGGGGERRAHATNARRTSYFDEHDEPRAGGGRGGGGGAAHNQRWKEDARRARPATSPPAGRGIGGGGTTRKRNDITPSRRRVTERVTMERVHHFDDTDESDEQRYESDNHPFETVYNEEYVEDFTSVAQADGRRYGQHRGGGGVPVITEMSDSEDSLERKRRELRQRKEARGRMN